MAMRIIRHKKTYVVLRTGRYGEDMPYNEEIEDAVDVDEDIDFGPTEQTKYWLFHPVKGRQSAKVKDIIESGVGDGDRALAKSEFIAAVQQLKADSVIGPRLRRLLDAMEDFYRNHTL